MGGTIWHLLELNITHVINKKIMAVHLCLVLSLILFINELHEVPRFCKTLCFASVFQRDIVVLLQWPVAWRISVTKKKTRKRRNQSVMEHLTSFKS